MFNKKRLAIIGLIVLMVIACFSVAMAYDKIGLEDVGLIATLLFAGGIGLIGETSVLEKTVVSAAAITEAFTIAKNGADDDAYIVATGATDNLVAIFQHTVTASGKVVRLMTHGFSSIAYGGTVTRGAPLTSDANGRAVVAVAGQNIIGFATVSGVIADIGYCRLAPGILASSGAVDGNTFKFLARATFDATAGKAIGSHGLGVTLPDNAIITRSWYEVITTFTSATDAGTIALSIPTDDVAGIKAAVAIDDVGNPWDAGIVEGIQDGTAAAFSVKTTAARELTADVAVEALTAGVLVLFCEYVISE